jgi:hypothetical protein
MSPAVLRRATRGGAGPCREEGAPPPPAWGPPLTRSPQVPLASDAPPRCFSHLPPRGRATSAAQQLLPPCATRPEGETEELLRRLGCRLCSSACLRSNRRRTGLRHGSLRPRAAADGAPPWLPPPEGGGGRGSAMAPSAPRSPSFHHRHPDDEGDGGPTASAPSSRGLAAADARRLGREDGHHRRQEQGGLGGGGSRGGAGAPWCRGEREDGVGRWSGWREWRK